MQRTFVSKIYSSTNIQIPVLAGQYQNKVQFEVLHEHVYGE
jgi:hypothetical protein